MSRSKSPWNTDPHPTAEGRAHRVARLNFASLEKYIRPGFPGTDDLFDEIETLCNIIIEAQARTENAPSIEAQERTENVPFDHDDRG